MLAKFLSCKTPIHAVHCTPLMWSQLPINHLLQVSNLHKQHRMPFGWHAVMQVC